MYWQVCRNWNDNVLLPCRCLPDSAIPLYQIKITFLSDDIHQGTITIRRNFVFWHRWEFALLLLTQQLSLIHDYISFHGSNNDHLFTYNCITDACFSRSSTSSNNKISIAQRSHGIEWIINFCQQAAFFGRHVGLAVYLLRRCSTSKQTKKLSISQITALIAT